MHLAPAADPPYIYMCVYRCYIIMYMSLYICVHVVRVMQWYKIRRNLERETHMYFDTPHSNPNHVFLAVYAVILQANLWKPSCLFFSLPRTKSTRLVLVKRSNDRPWAQDLNAATTVHLPPLLSTASTAVGRVGWITAKGKSCFKSYSKHPRKKWREARRLRSCVKGLEGGPT